MAENRNEKEVLLKVRTDTSEANSGLEEVRGKIEQANQSAKELSRVDYGSMSVKELKEELDKAEMSMEALARSGNATEGAMKVLGDRVDEINTGLGTLATNNATEKFEANMRVAIGTVEAVGGALTFVGVESETANLALARMAGLMSFTNGIKDIIDYGKEVGVTQNLTKLWERAQKATNVQLTATKGLMASLGIGLVVIALGTLITYWDDVTEALRLNTKETDKANTALTDYAGNVKAITEARAAGELNAVKELTNVQQLYRATQNLNLPMKDRIKYAEELIKKGGDLYKSISAEAIVAGKASKEYDKLTISIRQTALAQAYAQRMTDNATASLNNSLTILSKANELLQLRQQIAEQESLTTVGQGVGATSEAIEAGNIRRLNELYKKEEDLVKGITDLNTTNARIAKEQKLLQNSYDNTLPGITPPGGDDDDDSSGLGNNTPSTANKDEEWERPEDKERKKALERLVEFNKQASEVIRRDTMEAREFELDSVRTTYAEKIALAESLNEDTTDLLKAQRIEEQAINDRYDEEEIRKKAHYAILKAETEYLNTVGEHDLNTKEGREAEFNARMTELTAQYEAELTLFEDDLETRKNIEARYLATKTQMEEDYTEKSKELETQKWMKIGQMASDGLNIIGGFLEEGSAEAKAIAIANATIQGIVGSINAYTSTAAIPVIGPALAPYAAGVAGAAAMASIYKIASVNPSRNGSTSPNPDLGTGGGRAPVINTTILRQPDPTDINSLGDNQSEAPTAPIRAYIVDRDIQKSRNKNELTDNLSTF